MQSRNGQAQTAVQQEPGNMMWMAMLYKYHEECDLLTTILILIIFFFTFSRTCAGLLKVHYAAWRRVYHLQGYKTQKIRERHRDST